MIGENINTTLNASETAMEHRTLKQRDHSGSRTVKNLAAHFQNLKNIQPTPQSIESYGNLSNNLPPPVRITPYSGVKPKGMNIIRPVAFRPYASCKSDKRQAVISSSSFSFYNSNKKKNDFLAKRLSNSDELKRSSQHSKDTVPNPSAPSSVNGNNRPRAIYQPSTSASFELASAVMAQRRSGKFEATENDYDVVPEYIERDKFYIDADSTVTENYSVAHPTPYSRNLTSETFHPATAIMQNSSISTGRDKPQQQNSNAAVSVAAGISSLNLVKKSPSSHQVYGSNTSSGSRHSSGIHVTPSPSDSGIADYETIIRDKENELTNVRATMEQNEEIVVKVYLEKERLWKEQLADLKQKLQASQQGENALREQIQRCNDEREQFQVTIQNLTSDKQGLQRKSLQLERELFQLRECFDELIRNRDETVCGSCRKRITCDVTVASTNSSAADKRVKPPLPTPRYSKESSSERELRSEVEELKNEVSTLRDKLNEQIGLFTNERKRWEEERVKFLNFNNSPSDRLGLLSTHDSPPADLNSQLSRDLKILSDGKSYIWPPSCIPPPQPLPQLILILLLPSYALLFGPEIKITILNGLDKNRCSKRNDISVNHVGSSDAFALRASIGVNEMFHAYNQYSLHLSADGSTHYFKILALSMCLDDDDDGDDDGDDDEDGGGDAEKSLLVNAVNAEKKKRWRMLMDARTQQTSIVRVQKNSLTRDFGHQIRFHRVVAIG
ncbi:unnamed protein product [Litomosoides sigmodontis]|uniref:Uncharacterized protein n=1 Tax=Litomosoides sigmodontis TaxID=42156 RepID=A0A3P6UUK9_LITSI|nr:unnamed protein product [Litomosoides sigmodontis]